VVIKKKEASCATEMINQYLPTRLGLSCGSRGAWKTKISTVHKDNQAHLNNK
jgi:hypothetical protein